MTTEVVIGVDSSTQSCTVEVRDLATGALRGTGRAPHPATHPPVSEQAPEAWWQALVTAVRSALKGLDVHVAGISVGAQCHGLVAMDAEWTVIRPAKLWNDTTSAGQAAELVARFGTAWWTHQVGVVPSAAITLSKLAWLRDHEPESFARIRHLAVPHDWLTFRLSGRHVTDRSDASGTGYFSADTMVWRTDILDDAVEERDWAPLLPEVVGPNDPVGRLSTEAAAELGIDEGAIVGPGGGDRHLAAQGTGLADKDIAYSLGTSGVVMASTPTPVKDPEGHIHGVANVTGGFLPWSAHSTRPRSLTHSPVCSPSTTLS